MSHFTELTKERYSVRKYTNKTVEQEKIETIIETCRIAPSANNSQPWKIIIVDDLKVKEEVAKATFSKAVSFNKFALQAPILAVITIEKPKLISQVGSFLKKREYSLIDIGIFAEHFCLQATELGLGTCIMGWFNEKKIKNVLKIPNSKRIALVISLGYKANESKIPNKNRKATQKICSFNQY